MNKLNDEAPELGITSIPPRRLNSTSNILEMNNTVDSSYSKLPSFRVDSIQESAVQIYENKEFTDDSFKDLSQLDGKLLKFFNFNFFLPFNN